MWPLELTATPATSPRWTSGGSFRKSGTEWKRTSGGCWANRGAAAKKSRTKTKRFMGYNLANSLFCFRIIRGFGESVACYKSVLSVGEGNDGAPPPPNKPRVLYY